MLFLCFVLFEIRLLSHTLHPKDSFLFLLSSWFCRTSPLTQIHSPFISSSERFRPLRDDIQTEQNKIQKHKAKGLISRLDRAIEQEEDSPKWQRVRDIYRLHCYRCHRNTMLRAITHAEHLVQTHAGPVVSASVSVSVHKPYLDDLVGHALLVPSISFDSYNLSSPSSTRLPNPHQWSPLI